MHYSCHNTLLISFRNSGTTVKDGELVSAPALGDFKASVRERTDLLGLRQEVRLTDEAQPWMNVRFDYDPAEKQWDFTPTVADKLNQLGVTPSTMDGRVWLVIDRNGEEDPLTEEQIEFLELDPSEDGSFGTLEEHPEGVDRGGYVPELNGGPYFSGGDGEWR